MEITMHGAGQEVGRSCIELAHDGKRILLDGGIKINKEGNEFPTTIKKPSGIDLVFLSHAHMDHSGALPLLRSKGVKCPIVTTACTKDITRVLLQDSWKIDRIENRQKTYAKTVIGDVLDSMVLRPRGKIKGLSYSMHPTGHIISSQATLMRFSDKKVLYSGDVNGTDTHLLVGRTEYPQADVLILESTYGAKDHPDREDVEAKFVETVKDTLKRKGSVLCAAFAVGRAQELMVILHKAGVRVPIYLDGMSKKMLKIFLKHSNELKDDALQQATSVVHSVDSWKMRKKIARSTQPCVIIATAGMMDAGPVLGYLKHLYNNPKHAVLLTGFQAPGTNGRLLLNTGTINLDGRTVRVDAHVQHFDLSAHAGMQDLHKMIQSVSPKHLVLNHGEHEGCLALAEYAESLGITAHLPATGETITL